MASREELERAEGEHMEAKEKAIGAGMFKKRQALEKSLERASRARDMVLEEKKKREGKQGEGKGEEAEKSNTKGGGGKKKGKKGGDLSGVNEETLLKMLESKQCQVNKAQQQFEEIGQTPPFQLYFEKKEAMEKVHEESGWAQAKRDLDALLKDIQGRFTLHQFSGKLFESAAQEFAEGLAEKKELLALPNLVFRDVQLPQSGATGEFDFVVIDPKSKVNEVEMIIECKRNVTAVVRDLKKKLKAGEFFCGKLEEKDFE